MLGLVLIASIGGGASTASFAGARRTVSTYPEFRAATHAFDDLVGVNGGPTQPDAVQQRMLRPLENLPGIIDWSLTDAFACVVTGPSGAAEAFPDLFVIASPDGGIGRTLNAIKLDSGRYADPARTDEAVVTSQEAQHLGARVGSTLKLQFPSVVRTVHVVGIGIMAGAVDPTAAGYAPIVLLTPAFYAQNSGPNQLQGPTLAVRVRGGVREIPRLEKELAAVNPDISSTITAAAQGDSVRRTAIFEAVGLVVFGGLALITVLSIFAQLLARQIFLESSEQDVLRALGMSRSQLFGVAMLRVAVVGVTTAALSVAIAIAASALFPIGFMRRLEISPGVHMDVTALLAGAAAVFVLIVLSGVWPAWRASASAVRESAVGTNAAANVLAGASFPPSAVAGVRMALEPGRGQNAVPVRTAIFGTVLALAALLAALTFGAGLKHLVSTPSLSGWNFDAILPGTGPQFDDIGRALRKSSVVRSFAVGTFPNFQIGGIPMNGFAFAPGPFGPSMAAGRAPKTATEIALSPKTLRGLHTAIGRTIRVQGVDPSTNQPIGNPVPMRVVGEAVTPQFFFSQFSSNYSAVVAEAFVDSMHVPGAQADTYYVRFRAGVPIDTAMASIRAELPESAFILRRAESSDLANLNHIASLPNALAALLALVAAGTLVHTLVSSVRRRRRDLAILRALGFVRRQVTLTVAWQATTIVLIALAVGVPIGAVAGRLAWHLFVDQLGFVPVTVVPVVAVLVSIPAVIVLANAIATIPARAAAHAEPALALRTE